MLGAGKEAEYSRYSIYYQSWSFCLSFSGWSTYFHHNFLQRAHQLIFYKKPQCLNGKNDGSLICGYGPSRGGAARVVTRGFRGPEIFTICNFLCFSSPRGTFLDPRASWHSHLRLYTQNKQFPSKSSVLPVYRET